MLRHSAVSTDTVLTTVSELRFRHQFAPDGGLGACPQVAKRNGFQQCSCTHEPCSRSSLLAYRWPPSRLINMAPLALRTHARTRSRTLLTIERTCPAGASWCSWPHSRPTDPAVGRISGAGVFSLRSFSIFYFVTRLAQHPGAAPPGPKGQRGHIWLSRRSRLRPAKR